MLNFSSNNDPPENNPKVFHVNDKVLVLLNDAKVSNSTLSLICYYFFCVL
jgi:hypothetical protein